MNWKCFFGSHSVVYPSTAYRLWVQYVNGTKVLGNDTSWLTGKVVKDLTICHRCGKQIY